MKIIIYSLRASYVHHITLGRFDQYMYPYYVKSIESGSTDADILEQTELFFISVNLDTDLYSGVQQGDNGQSLVLGGRTQEKEDAYNELSEIVMSASEELCIIDPKINLRVDKNGSAAAVSHPIKTREQVSIPPSISLTADTCHFPGAGVCPWLRL